MAPEKINPFDSDFDLTVSEIDVSGLEAALDELRAAERRSLAGRDVDGGRDADGPARRADAQPVPTLPDDASPAEQTIILDTKQHAELMALRAQQDVTLRKRFEKSVAVMFTDLVGSTAYYERYGDLKGREKVLTHNALLFPRISNAGGVVIKTIGDAIMACFESANDALAVAASMQHVLAEHNRDVPVSDDQIHIRIAINYGVAIAQEGDLHGDVVNVAARIEHETPADEVWVSDRVLEESDGWPFESVGEVSLRGKAGTTALYRLLWRKVGGPEAVRGPARLPPAYEIRDMLGHGSIGDAFRGRERKSGRSVRIKGLHGFLARDLDARGAFFSAATEMMRLDHEGVVRVLEVCGPAEVDPWFITEDVPGTTLEQLVRRHGCPPPHYAALIGYRLAQILAFAHTKDVLHENLQPEHVLVTDTGAVKLTSFGLSRVATSQIERTGSALGNPAFMAPEVMVRAATDERSDVYTLGALLYYLLCGRAPYEAAASVKATREVTSGGFTPIASLNPHAPERLVNVVGRSLSIMPDSRPADMATVAAELRGFFEVADLSLARDLGPFLRVQWPASRAAPAARRPRGAGSVPAPMPSREDTAPMRSRERAAPVPSREDTAPVPELSRVVAGAVGIDDHPDVGHRGVGEAARSAGSRVERRDRSQVSVAAALLGAVLLAALAFAAGFEYGGNRARASIERAKVDRLRPVEEGAADVPAPAPVAARKRPLAPAPPAGVGERPPEPDPALTDERSTSAGAGAKNPEPAANGAGAAPASSGERARDGHAGGMEPASNGERAPGGSAEDATPESSGERAREPGAEDGEHDSDDESAEL